MCVSELLDMCVHGYYERTTGAKHNSGGEKNMVGLANSRASRYHTVTNKKWEPLRQVGPVSFWRHVRQAAAIAA